MDFHVLIVIACVFLASLCSLLFINKFFRGKTFEEVAAEKKLLAEKLYGTSKPKRQQRKVVTKKETKKEKKHKQKDSSASKEDVDSPNDSEGPSDTQSVENSPSHKKPHVEFSEPEVIAEEEGSVNNPKRSNAIGEKAKQGKRKLSNIKLPGTGILVNKSEQIFVKETSVVESLNNFEAKQPKDVVELKKSPKDDKEKENTPRMNNKEAKKSNKSSKKDQKEQEKVVEQAQPAEEVPAVKEVKKVEEKANKNHDSPKNQTKAKKEKKKTDHGVSILDKLDTPDLITVNCLMTLFSRAELNRNEIQMLIDYLLNKQQDTLANHSEWSDDIVLKLKKQLAEKDKALQEEQEASIGIQAKLRDLRAEINAERAQYNASLKVLNDEINAKKLEIHNLSQEVNNLTDKMVLERQQFQNKLRHEKQAGSQELLAQIQLLNERNNILQEEIVQKNTYVNEMQRIVNASHQAVEDTKSKLNEVIQQKVAQIHALEQNINEAEKTIGRQQYELAKMAENDKENSKVEIRNLQNALDSTKAELSLARNEVNESKQRIEILTAQIDELNKTIVSINSKYQEQFKDSNEMRDSLNKYKIGFDENVKKIAEYEVSLQTLANREDELMKQIQEQKEKNNDLRTKNWKLVEALQTAESNAVKVEKKKFINLVHQSEASPSSSKDEQRIRALLQRLYPEATKATVGSALSLSFDQWIEQVVATHIKQNIPQPQRTDKSNNSKLLQENSSDTKSSSHNHQTNTQSTNHNHHNSNSEESSNSSNSNDSINNSKDDSTQNLMLQNAQLRARIEQLTSIVTKTENMLTDIETRAREQDAYWRSVVQAKQKEINSLKNSNGQAI